MPLGQTWGEGGGVYNFSLETQSQQLRVTDSEHAGNISEIKIENVITEVHLKQPHTENCRTAASSSITHSVSDSGPKKP